MKSKKSKFLRKLRIAREFPSEPKVMEELHRIREEMSKMSKKDFHESLKKASEDFKKIINK